MVTKTRFQKKPGGGKQRQSSGHRFRQRPKAGQIQRRGTASWEDVTNKQQRALTRAFDTWAASVKRHLVVSKKRGDSKQQRLALLDHALPRLAESMIEAMDTGLLSATIASAGARSGFPDILDMLEEKSLEATRLIRENYIPTIREGLAAKIEEGMI